MPRTEAQIRAERARNERVTTVTIRLEPEDTALIDKARGDQSRPAYIVEAAKERARKSRKR